MPPPCPASHPDTLRIDASPEEGGLPAVHLLLRLAGQFQLPVILVDIPARQPGGEARRVTPIHAGG